jgi:hypothetical protein
MRQRAIPETKSRSAQRSKFKKAAGTFASAPQILVSSLRPFRGLATLWERMAASFEIVAWAQPTSFYSQKQLKFIRFCLPSGKGAGRSPAP